VANLFLFVLSKNAVSLVDFAGQADVGPVADRSFGVWGRRKIRKAENKL
jgi:hypothetical protein